MRASFAVRGPGEQQEGCRGLLGFLAKSHAAHLAERSSSSYVPSSESDDDGDPARFRYPGMPREPRPIKLTDPYPGGRLAGSKAAADQFQEVQPLVHDGSTTVLFVKAGSEHRALLYLMQKVNRYFALDDMLPEVSPDIAAYHYVMLAPPKDGPVDGDASTSFRNSTLFLLSGMVARRVKMLAKDPMTLGLMDSTVLQRRMPMRKLGFKLADPPNGSAGAGGGSFGGGGSTGAQFTRKASFAARLGPEASVGSDTETGRRDSKRWASNRRARRNGPPELIPVAIYSHPLYLDTAASIIRSFNRTGLIVTPYLYSTIVAAAAVCTIQGWWRSHLIRGLSNFAALLKMSRAARAIQRAWRAFMLRSRLLMLSTVRRLTAIVGSLLLGANLALTVGHCMALRERAGRPRPAALFPEQRLRFGFDRAGGLMLIEPERMMPKPLRDGNWNPGLPPPPVPRSLPEWCGVPLLMCGERAAASVHGCREVHGLDSILNLITRDTVWRDNAGNDLSRATLPDVNLPDPGATAATLAGGGTANDVVLAIITFPSVHEAAVRAAMLSIYTWDPRRRTGVNLVPLHQTAAARGVQAQAAVVQAINTIAASAGHLVTTTPDLERPAATPPGLAGPGSSPACTSTTSLAWRHAPPGGRERQRGNGAIPLGVMTPSLELRSPIRALGSTSPYLSGGGSPLLTGGPSASSSFSLVPVPSGSHQSLSRNHSHSHLHGHTHTHVHMHGGSPARAVSPTRQRYGGSSGIVPGSPSGSPRKAQRSPQPGGVAQPLSPPPPPPGGAAAGSRTPSPMRLLGPQLLQPVQARPGTVPPMSASKFKDLEPVASTTGEAQIVEGGGGGGGGDAATKGPALPPLQLQLPPGGPEPPRPRSTPVLTFEGDISPVMSLCGTEPFMEPAMAARSSGGLYGTQPGAPLPMENVPLSALARALSPPSSYRTGGPPRASHTNTALGGPIEGGGGGGGREADSTGLPINREPPTNAHISVPVLPSPLSTAAAYRGYDMPSTEWHVQKSGGLTAATVADDVYGGTGPIAGEDGTATPARATTASTLWDGERGDTPIPETGDGAWPAAEGHQEDEGLPQVPSTPLGKDATGDQGPARPGGEAEEEGGAEALQSRNEPEPEVLNPYRHVTVLQRHQAIGLYSDMLLLPVPRRPPGASVETAEEAAAREGLVADDIDSYYDSVPARQSSADLLPGPPEVAQPPGPSRDGVEAAAGAESSAENPELVVAPLFVEYVDPASVMAGLTEVLGNQGRSNRHYADTTIRIGKLITAEEAFARHRQLMSTLMLTQVIGRQTAVGHVQAPNYTPVSVRAMNQIVAEMRRVYRGEAAELVANMREQHKEAITAVKEDLAATARAIASTSCMQAAVVDSELARAEEERNRAVRMRATRAHLRALRRERALQDRAFAAAFGRQVAGSSKQIVRSEIRARDAVMAELTATQGSLRRQINQATQEHIAMAAAEMSAANRMRASTIRSEGWTAQVASHYHLLDQWQADLVALRRDDNYARMRRVGPAGGVWGSARPRELLRIPLPITNVVSAATAAAASTSSDVSGNGGSYGSTSGGGPASAVVAAPAAGAWRSLSAGDARQQPLMIYTPPDTGGSGGDGDGLFARIPTRATRVSFNSVWPLFEGDHGSMAASSAPPSTLPSRQTPHRRSMLPLPQPLPEGYVPGGSIPATSANTAALSTPATPPPLIEDSEAPSIGSHGSNGELEVVQSPEVSPSRSLRPGAKAAALSASAMANGLRQRGSPPRNLVEGSNGRLVDFLPEAYSVQPFGSRQGNNPSRPIGMVVSRY